MKNLSILITLTLLAFAFATSSADTISKVSASTPCDNITGNPHPPIGKPEPVGGTVVNGDTNAAIAGATVILYRCDGSTATQVSTTTSSTLGTFSFDNLSTPYWYYVQFSLTGPLAGMSPAAGTSNPSELVEVGEGDESLWFEFE